jgi:thioredoxin reductase
MFDVVVIGAGPAGVLAALRAGDPGATTALVVTGDQFGGMASLWTREFHALDLRERR